MLILISQILLKKYKKKKRNNKKWDIHYNKNINNRLILKDLNLNYLIVHQQNLKEERREKGGIKDEKFVFKKLSFDQIFNILFL